MLRFNSENNQNTIKGCIKIIFESQKACIINVSKQKQIQMCMHYVFSSRMPTKEYSTLIFIFLANFKKIPPNLSQNRAKLSNFLRKKLIMNKIHKNHTFPRTYKPKNLKSERKLT